MSVGKSQAQQQDLFADFIRILRIWQVRDHPLGVLRASKKQQQFYKGPFFHFSQQAKNEFTSLQARPAGGVEGFDCSWNIYVQRHLLNRHTARRAFIATEMLHLKQGK